MNASKIFDKIKGSLVKAAKAVGKYFKDGIVQIGKYLSKALGSEIGKVVVVGSIIAITIGGLILLVKVWHDKIVDVRTADPVTQAIASSNPQLKEQIADITEENANRRSEDIEYDEMNVLYSKKERRKMESKESAQIVKDMTKHLKEFDKDPNKEYKKINALAPYLTVMDCKSPYAEFLLLQYPEEYSYIKEELLNSKPFNDAPEYEWIDIRRDKTFKKVYLLQTDPETINAVLKDTELKAQASYIAKRLRTSSSKIEYKNFALARRLCKNHIAYTKKEYARICEYVDKYTKENLKNYWTV